MRIKKSLIPGAGWGLIDENRNFHTGNDIAEYKGTHMTPAQYEQFPSHDYGFEMRTSAANNIIVPEKTTSSFACYANSYRSRNRDPSRGITRNNAQLVYNSRSRTAWLRALHPIHPGQEILTSYGRGWRI